MLDLLELGELFLSWRLYVVLLLTALLCWLVILSVPDQSAQLKICIPIGLVGLFLGFRWQIRADQGK